jgi:predicted nucleotidyltransferase
MEPSFEKLLALLAESEVRFVVVGGIAVTLHGYVRLTEDVDLLVADDVTNLERLLVALKHFGEGFAAELAPTDFDDSEGAIRIVEETESCHIDLFTRMSGRRYEDVLADAETFEIRGLPVRYASKASLIAWKEASVREKDRLDAMALRRLQADPHALD